MTAIIVFKLLESVLIDTWWNVNMIVASLQQKMLMVLIDTWWNVNPINITSVTLSLSNGFNRYMVECKSC